MAPHNGVIVVYVLPRPGRAATVLTGLLGYDRKHGSDTAPLAPMPLGMLGVPAVLRMYFGRILLSWSPLVVPGPLVLLEDPRAASRGAQATTAADANRPRREMVADAIGLLAGSGLAARSMGGATFRSRRTAGDGPGAAATAGTPGAAPGGGDHPPPGE